MMRFVVAVARVLCALSRRIRLDVSRPRALNLIDWFTGRRRLCLAALHAHPVCQSLSDYSRLRYLLVISI